MFDLADRPLVWIPVKWTVLRPGEGDKEEAVETEVSIKIEVELKDRDDIAELSVKMFGLDPEEKPEASIADQLKDAKKGREKEVELFMQLVTNWKGVKKSGVDVDFNAENVRAMLGVPGFWGAFQSAYMSACVGKRETRKGN
jgi:hypothetical protein